MPEEDFHLPDCMRFQAHRSGPIPAARVSTALSEKGAQKA